MKITTGVDIVGIERMDKAVHQWGDRFLEKIFTVKELMQAKERGLPAQHLAGKFAAKEAVFKALSEFRNGESLRWCDIEILNYSDGRPKVILHNGAGSIQKKFVLSQVQVSISHDKQWAVASSVVVSEKLGVSSTKPFDRAQDASRSAKRYPCCGETSSANEYE